MTAPTEAERFLRALGGDFTFQTFDDAKSPTKKRDPLAKWMHGTLAEHADKLTDLNARGAGAFVMVNEGDGKGRRIANVRRVRAYFADFDQGQPPDVATVPLAPHAIIESSPNRWHWYWFIDGARLTAFKLVQRAIAGRLGSDPAVCDLPRVMRLPGFLHRKGEPFLTRIKELRDAPRYTHAKFAQAFGIDLSELAQQTVGKRPDTSRNSTVTRLPTAQRRTRALPDVIPEGARNTTLLSLAAGLVRTGHDVQAVTDRLQRINAEKCATPLCATEVDTIAMQASNYGSEGFVMLPHRMLDSPEWKGLPPPAHDIVLTAFRRYNGANNGNIALTHDDCRYIRGCADESAFLAYRMQAVDAGFLIVAEQPTMTRNGRTPTLYALPPRFMPKPNRAKHPASANRAKSPVLNR